MDIPEDCPKTRAYEKECFPWRQHVEIDGVVQPYMGNHAAHSVATKADAAIHELLGKARLIEAFLRETREQLAQAQAKVKRLEWMLQTVAQDTHTEFDWLYLDLRRRYEEAHDE